MKDKRGHVLLGLIMLIIIAFVGVLFFASWIYAHNILTESLIAVDSSQVNVSGAAEVTFGQLNEAMPILRWVAFSLIFGSILGILVTNFLVKVHPAFFIVYILFVVVSVIFSANVSNAYEDLLNNDILGETLQTFTASNFFFLELPIWIAIIGIIGGILLFIGISADKDAGGSII